MKLNLLHQLILFIFISTIAPSYSQLPDFFYQLPYSFKISETAEAEIIQNENLILDKTDYSNLYTKKNKYAVDYRVYRWECEIYCYIDTATKKLTGIKIWNTPDNWESNGIQIGMTEKRFLDYLKNQDLVYSAFKCKYFNDYTIETSRLTFSFSFPKDDYISATQPCWSETAGSLKTVYVGLKDKLKNTLDSNPAEY